MNADILLDLRRDTPPRPPSAFRAVQGRFETVRPVTTRELIRAALDLLTDNIEAAAVYGDPPGPPPNCSSGRPSDVCDWLRLYFSDKDQELAVVGFMDRSGRVITVEALGRGTTDMVLICTRTLARRALELGAFAAWLAHGHPAGDCEPSDADLVQSARLARELAPLGIALTHSHIIGGGRVRSLTPADWAKEPAEYLKPLLIEDRDHAHNQR